jgi:hypothetical protein
LKHFSAYSKGRTVGTHRLLIIDGHESHESLEFQQYCKDNDIVALCMPPHSSHLLQPLDVGCFAPLKLAYGRQAEKAPEHQLFQVSERSIAIDFSFKYDLNAFVNLFPNILYPLQALWPARCPVLSSALR